MNVHDFVLDLLRLSPESFFDLSMDAGDSHVGRVERIVMLNPQGIVHFGIDFEWLLCPHFTFH